jgi:hypothetical protein
MTTVRENGNATIGQVLAREMEIHVIIAPLGLGERIIRRNDVATEAISNLPVMGVPALHVPRGCNIHRNLYVWIRSRPGAVAKRHLVIRIRISVGSQHRASRESEQHEGCDCCDNSTHCYNSLSLRLCEDYYHCGDKAVDNQSCHRNERRNGLARFADHGNSA